MEKNLKKAFDYHQNNHFSKAEKKYNEIIKADSKNHQALTLLGTLKLQQGDLDSAEFFLNKSLDINRNQFLAHQNIGIVFSKKKNYQRAICSLDECLKQNPNYFHAYNEKGYILYELQKYHEAITTFKKAILLNPFFAESYNNLGNCYRELGNAEDAKQNFTKALQINKNFYEANINLGNSYKDINDLEKAKIYYQNAIECNSNNSLAKYNLSLINLSEANFIDGWEDFKHRWHDTKKPFFCNEIRELNDMNINSNILVWGEQGIGDHIIFSSLLSDFNESQNITAALDKRLLSIFKRSFKNINFIDIDNIGNLKKYDYQISVADLGLYLRPKIASFNKQPYSFLKSDKDIKEEFKKEINCNKKICGISWRSKNKSFGHLKSIDLIELEPILKMQKYLFVDLQYGNTEEEIKLIKSKINLNLFSPYNLDKFNDLEGLAALIDVCDIIITCCNITAHLAGSLGKETFLMTPFSMGGLWYWQGKDKSIWYPSVKIFKQNKYGAWNDVITNIQKQL